MKTRPLGGQQLCQYCPLACKCTARGHSAGPSRCGWTWVAQGRQGADYGLEWHSLVTPSPACAGNQVQNKLPCDCALQPFVAKHITAADRGALAYLTDVRYQRGAGGMLLEFHFAPDNPYFENRVRASRLRMRGHTLWGF